MSLEEHHERLKKRLDEYAHLNQIAFVLYERPAKWRPRTRSKRTDKRK